jgi:2,3-bisphosphoglycerate-independent phosphoglycerate mutase
MLYTDGEPNPSHGLNPVPFIIVSNYLRLKHAKLREGLGLSSIAPTVLHLLGIKKPREMTGKNLILKNK